MHPSPAHPDPRWPTSPRPLRVLILGWARLSLQEREGSGYNLVASELAGGLAMSGHDVTYLSSGRVFSLRPGMRVRDIETWRGVRCRTIVNAPCFAPAAFNLRNTPAEIASPGLAACVVAEARRARTQVVHVHSLEGFSLDVVPGLRRAGFCVVVTPHDYWYLSPRVDMLDPIEDPLAPAVPPGPHSLRRRRKLGQTLESLIGMKEADVVRKACYRAARRVLGMAPPPRPEDDPFAPPRDAEYAAGYEAVSAGDHPPPPALDAELLPEECPIEPVRSPIDLNERFLDGRHRPRVIDEFPRRAEFGVGALESASAVTPPSGFMLKAYRSRGLDSPRSRVVRLGLPHLDQIHRRVKRSPFYEHVPWTPATIEHPLRFAYFGTARYNKGLDVLVRAIPLLERSVRRRCQFLIRAAGPTTGLIKRLAAYPEASFVGGYHPFQLAAAAGDYDVGIMTHLWFENSPIVLLEHLHAGKLVITPRLGGVVEWVVEPNGDAPGNGLYYAGGHAEQLADRITRVVTGEAPLPSARTVHELTPNLSEYPVFVQRTQQLYAELLSAGGGSLVESKPATRAVV